MDSSYTTIADNRTIYITVTAYPETVTDWIIGVNNHFQSKQTAIFGLDIEWKPNWGYGEPNPAATLQICAGNRCLIIQLIHISHFPRSLERFLTNPRYTFAGVEIEKDAEKLYEDYGLEIENLYDLREEAMERSPERLSQCPGLKELASEVAGVSIEKPQNVRVSDWDAEVLSLDQIGYACLDAYASCRVALVLFFYLDWG